MKKNIFFAVLVLVTMQQLDASFATVPTQEQAHFNASLDAIPSFVDFAVMKIAATQPDATIATQYQLAVKIDNFDCPDFRHQDVFAINKNQSASLYQNAVTQIDQSGCLFCVWALQKHYEQLKQVCDACETEPADVSCENGSCTFN